MNDVQVRPARRASLGRVLRRGFREAYDNLGYVLAASFASFVVAGGLFGAAVALARATRPGMFVGAAMFLPAALAGWLAALGVCYYANRVVRHEHPSPAETLAGIRILLGPALKLFALDLLVCLVLVVDTVVFVGIFGAKGNMLFVIPGVVCGYGALVWAMMMLYHLPLLAAQLTMESGPRVGVIVRKSFLLAADNAGFTVGLFLAIIALALVCALPAMIGTATFFAGGAAFLVTHALRELFTKYGIIDEEPEAIEDEGWPRG